MNFPGKVLLVDDEVHIRKFVGLILRQLGATQILEAANGEAALTVFAAERPDLVLLDVNMPILDGIETLKRMIAIDPDVVVIMLTSLANRLTIEEAMANGAANYIRKDTPKEEIAKALTETVEACFSAE